MQESPPTATRASAPATKTAVIGAGIEIAGDVAASADLSINGKVSGSIVQSTHDVDIAESGKVKANISARVVKVAGEVEGISRAAKRYSFQKPEESGEISFHLACNWKMVRSSKAALTWIPPKSSSRRLPLRQKRPLNQAASPHRLVHLRPGPTPRLPATEPDRCTRRLRVERNQA